MTRLSEHIPRVADVLCLIVVTIRAVVHERLDAEGLVVRPCLSWGEGTLAWHALELQEARQMRERAPQP